MGKARVTPLKPIARPRLELKAALVSLKVKEIIHLGESGCWSFRLAPMKLVLWSLLSWHTGPLRLTKRQKALMKWGRFHHVRDFQMDGSRCHAGEKNAILLHFLAAFSDMPRTKVIYASIGERRGPFFAPGQSHAICGIWRSSWCGLILLSFHRWSNNRRSVSQWTWSLFLGARSSHGNAWSRALRHVPVWVGWSGA